MSASPVAGVEQQLAAQVETVSKWVDVVTEFAVTYGFQILGALVFLLIGLKIAGWGGKRVTGLMEVKEIDQTLARFIGNLVKIVAVVFLVIITLGALLTLALKWAGDRAANTVLTKLAEPNGGKSLHDIAAKVDNVVHGQALHSLAQESLEARVERVENHLDNTLIPRQVDVLRAVGVDPPS